MEQSGHNPTPSIVDIQDPAPTPAFVPVPEIVGANLTHLLPQASRKRKPNASGTRTTSTAWNHFTRLPVIEGKKAQAACNYCKKTYYCNTKTHGTSNMLAHLKVCSKYTYAISSDPSQTILTFGRSGTVEGANLKFLESQFSTYWTHNIFEIITHEDDHVAMEYALGYIFYLSSYWFDPKIAVTVAEEINLPFVSTELIGGLGYARCLDMIQVVADLAYILGANMVIGSGWQVMVAYINLVCYYIVRAPYWNFPWFQATVKWLCSGGFVTEFCALTRRTFAGTWGKSNGFGSPFTLVLLISPSFFSDSLPSPGNSRPNPLLLFYSCSCTRLNFVPISSCEFAFVYSQQGGSSDSSFHSESAVQVEDHNVPLTFEQRLQVTHRTSTFTRELLYQWNLTPQNFHNIYRRLLEAIIICLRFQESSSCKHAKNLETLPGVCEGQCPHLKDGLGVPLAYGELEKMLDCICLGVRIGSVRSQPSESAVQVEDHNVPLTFEQRLQVTHRTSTFTRELLSQWNFTPQNFHNIYRRLLEAIIICLRFQESSSCKHAKNLETLPGVCEGQFAMSVPAALHKARENVPKIKGEVD
ncbi:hypothetical protein VNO77_22926 [Canavalia gladiata]|uniref:BED-type domain-containing protein n=1 Tax=Canavalia gladiata TaxID=3824 RepID=A0AAN9QEX7_CANGL